jgi:queuine/archaeosine tRNA-ribosyltransferase
MTDTPFTNAALSQKRVTKSIARSTSWLSDMIRANLKNSASPAHILVQMAGGSNAAARTAFAEGLQEILNGPEADAVRPLRRLDEGVSGYVFELAPLRQDAILSHKEAAQGFLPSMLRASLEAVSEVKPRIVHSSSSPHEMLDLIRTIGIDAFDAHWAQRAANIGVALDFAFPVRKSLPAAERRSNGKRDIGHNLYSDAYIYAFSPLADSYRGVEDAELCSCGACSPATPNDKIYHSSIDQVKDPSEGSQRLAPYTRAYLHHLLHTHEMSAHTLLAMHNLSVVDAMLTGVRSVIAHAGAEGFTTEVAKFVNEYDDTLGIFKEAEVMWQEVELARGKGRLKREKEKDALLDIDANRGL